MDLKTKIWSKFHDKLSQRRAWHRTLVHGSSFIQVGGNSWLEKVRIPKSQFTYNCTSGHMLVSTGLEKIVSPYQQHLIMPCQKSHKSIGKCLWCTIRPLTGTLHTWGKRQSLSQHMHLQKTLRHLGRTNHRVLKRHSINEMVNLFSYII